MSKFSIEDYLQALAKRMKDRVAREVKENKGFVYDSDEVVADLGEFEYNVVNYLNRKTL